MSTNEAIEAGWQKIQFREYIQKHYSFILFNCFILVRVTLDLESIPGTLSTRWECTLDEMLFHCPHKDLYTPLHLEAIKITIPPPVFGRWENSLTLFTLCKAFLSATEQLPYNTALKSHQQMFWLY